MNFHTLNVSSSHMFVQARSTSTGFTYKTHQTRSRAHTSTTRTEQTQTALLGSGESLTFLRFLKLFFLTGEYEETQHLMVACSGLGTQRIEWRLFLGPDTENDFKQEHFQGKLKRSRGSGLYRRLKDTSCQITGKLGVQILSNKKKLFYYYGKAFSVMQLIDLQ